LSAVSHPFAALLSQLPNPALHVIPQPVWPQEADPFVLLQVAPQARQLDVVLSAVSHPFVTFPSQLPNPVLHEPSPQVEFEQAPVALSGAQATPHPPQLFKLFVVLTSQPFA